MKKEWQVFPIFLKGKPPTKKAKVLQKQPLMAKLAAYAQYQANQQNQVKKAGECQCRRSAWTAIVYSQWCEALVPHCSCFPLHVGQGEFLPNSSCSYIANVMALPLTCHTCDTIFGMRSMLRCFKNVLNKTMSPLEWSGSYKGLNKKQWKKRCEESVRQS